jgi:hypothetical protein
MGHEPLVDNLFPDLLRVFRDFTQDTVNGIAHEAADIVRQEAPDPMSQAGIYVRTPSENGYDEAIDEVLSIHTTMETTHHVIDASEFLLPSVPLPPFGSAWIACCVNQGVIAEFGGVDTPPEPWFYSTFQDMDFSRLDTVRNLEQRLARFLGVA